MVEPNFRGGDVALFIDWENFKISLAAGNRSPNLSALKEEVSNQGRMVVAKAYADWVTRAPELRGASQFIIDPPSLYAAGIEPVFVPTRVPSTQASTANGMRTYRVKNSVDVKMTADCIECAHSYPNIGTFVLVSGDSDFLHVVNALRTMGKQVVVIGVSWSTSRRMADQVDSLLLYDKDVDPLSPQSAVLPQHANRREAPSAASSSQAANPDSPPELAEVIRAIEEIIREERAAGGQPLLTSIKQRMMRRFPSFDEKKLGFSGFKKLMARAAEDGNIKLIHSGLVDWAIMADEEVPEGTTEEIPSGVAARPGRRRGGRRRHGPQRDAEATDALGAEDADEGDEGDMEDAVFAGELEETAATDFDLPDIEESEDEDLEVESVEALEPDEPVVWFDVDEEVGAASEFAVETAAASGEPGAEPAEAGEAVSAEAQAPEVEEAESEPENVFGDDPDLAATVQQALASLSLPAEPEDGLNPERVSDLIVMADHLEHRQGVSHVAFNFLVGEVCSALEQGLAAGNEQIARRWSDASGKDYITKTLRGLSEGGFFRRSTHTWRDEATRRRRQRSTFNLDRDNELVGRMLTARLGPAAVATPPADPAGEQAPPADTAVEPQPDTEAEQLPLTNGAQAETAGIEAEPLAASEGAETEVIEEPESSSQAEDDADGEAEPVAVPDGDESGTAEGPEASAQPGGGADADEIYDEPQPRSTRRRRPFTSRLLRN